MIQSIQPRFGALVTRDLTPEKEREFKKKLNPGLKLQIKGLENLGFDVHVGREINLQGPDKLMAHVIVRDDIDHPDKFPASLGGIPYNRSADNVIAKLLTVFTRNMLESLYEANFHSRFGEVFRQVSVNNMHKRNASRDAAADPAAVSA